MYFWNNILYIFQKNINIFLNSNYYKILEISNEIIKDVYIYFYEAEPVMRVSHDFLIRNKHAWRIQMYILDATRTQTLATIRGPVNLYMNFCVSACCIFRAHARLHRKDYWFISTNIYNFFLLAFFMKFILLLV